MTDWHDDATRAVKKLFLAGEFDLRSGRDYFCFDDFTGFLFPESAEFQDLCTKAAKGEPADFDKCFNAVVDKWVEITVENMDNEEIREVSKYA